MNKPYGFQLTFTALSRHLFLSFCMLFSIMIFLEDLGGNSLYVNAYALKLFNHKLRRKT
jgi:hypothetical protein